VSDVPPGAIATVAGESIPRTLFDQLMRRIRRSYQLQRRTFPAAGTAASRKVRDDAVALLVWRVVVRQAATELGVRVPESVVEARLGQVREQWGGPASFQAVLRRLGLTETLLRDEIRTRMLLEAVRDSFWAATTVSDEEVASHYQRNLRDYVVPQNRDVRHILVRTRSRAGRLRAQIRAGASFGVLARRHSLDRATRNAGGALSVLRAGRVRASNTPGLRARQKPRRLAPDPGAVGDPPGGDPPARRRQRLDPRAGSPREGERADGRVGEGREGRMDGEDAVRAGIRAGRRVARLRRCAGRDAGMRG
jgi:hypothetical protein